MHNTFLARQSRNISLSLSLYTLSHSPRQTISCLTVWIPILAINIFVPWQKLNKQTIYGSATSQPYCYDVRKGTAKYTFLRGHVSNHCNITVRKIWSRAAKPVYSLRTWRPHSRLMCAEWIQSNPRTQQEALGRNSNAEIATHPIVFSGHITWPFKETTWRQHHGRGASVMYNLIHYNLRRKFYLQGNPKGCQQFCFSQLSVQHRDRLLDKKSSVEQVPCIHDPNHGSEIRAT
jgi:hypothetical protein